ncbi:hypothetical protein F7725_003345 [Dissostichus mawsoni]|uniref:ENTH domain-containing protein n=1 Tax=Dissostichus mawsoni TaxID=36200 RepID=A0A7J5YCI8_DISMA|nr:hypothetical protein F7725_003345 [Dissostichus mawsoni]
MTLLDYLIKSGSERVAKECRENIYTIQTLRDFQYIDRDGRDQGVNVREKAKQLVTLLKDDEKLKKERSQALKTKTRMAGASSSLGSGAIPPPYPGRRTSQPAGAYAEEAGRCRGSPSSFHSSSSSPRLAPDMEQALPSTSGEELQLQLALAMSREESEKPPPTVDIDEQTQLQIAMTLSKEETKKPVKPVPVALEMDEESQLQLALSLSKEEHQQEQLSRQGDELTLKKALEESKHEMDSKGGTAFMDLVDVFALPSAQPPRDHRWNNAPPQAAAPQDIRDPWDTMVDPWDDPQSYLKAPGQEWAFPPSTDGDLFDEAMDGGQVNLNGRGEGSPELFDLSRLGESLAAPSPRSCRTPEAFLGPTAASLVNLDALIPVNPPAKIMNPFLSGHFPSIQCLLALPMSHQPTSLPMSLTHPTQPGFSLPGTLPEPLLPFSSGSTDGSQAAQSSQNPFL